jgi:hypothetical protein
MNIKTVIIGPSNSGKSALLNVLKYNKFHNSFPTIGTQCERVVLKRVKFKLTLTMWEISSHLQNDERSKGFIPCYLEDSNLIIVVYNAQEKESLSEAVECFESIKSCLIGSENRIYFIGNCFGDVGRGIKIRDSFMYRLKPYFREVRNMLINLKKMIEVERIITAIFSDFALDPHFKQERSRKDRTCSTSYSSSCIIL